MRTKLIIIVIAFMACACSGDNRSELQSYAARHNHECPQAVDEELTITSYFYDKSANMFVINYESAEKSYTVKKMRVAEMPLRRKIEKNLQNDDLREFSEMLTTADASLRMRFAGKITDDTLDIDFSPAELKKTVNKFRR